jgi:hypothetical protein
MLFQSRWHVTCCQTGSSVVPKQMGHFSLEAASLRLSPFQFPFSSPIYRYMG